MNKFYIRLAAIEEGDYIIRLLKEAATWIQEQGIDQWQYLLDGGEDQEIIHCIADQLTYVAIMDSEIVATFTLYSEQNEWDQQIWGEAPADSIYLHRLAVKPNYMKHGIGKDVFKWLEEGHLQTDKKYLKLDCVAFNKKLNQFYQNNGFEFLGITNEHSKYQKQLQG
ncbi:GNAT family N-acetyltransferase [Heyndrickxia vini]|uniref:GNAT family N-acetyltransferase n=1 Tax=Heyndrickxia vini TaxID=1476025 RepID=UPI001FE8DC06|nr:GNAT family N-acetyltransferase [Heyndrickxia vini]